MGDQPPRTKKGPKGTNEVAESSRFRLAAPSKITALRVRGTGQHIALPSVVSFTLGREKAPGDPPEPRATVRLPSKGKGVSLQHAVFEWRGDRLWCRDAGSTNGTQANRQPQHDWFVVHSGMRLDFGDVAVIAMDWRLAGLCQPLAWCLGLEAHHEVDQAISTIQGGGPLVLIGPRHNDQEWLARKIHDASDRREYPFTPITSKLPRGNSPVLTAARFGSVYVDLAAVGKVTSSFASELFAGESPHLLVRPIIAAPTHVAVQRALQQLGEAQAMTVPPLARRQAEAVQLIDVLLKEHKSPHRLKDLGDTQVTRLAEHEWANLSEIREAERRIRAVLETNNRTQAAARIGTSRQALNKFLARILGA